MAFTRAQDQGSGGRVPPSSAFRHARYRLLCADGRLVLAVDVSPRLRPYGNTCTDRSFCRTYGRGRNERYPVV